MSAASTLGVLLAGVAGQGVEVAAGLLARAALAGGLEATLARERPPSPSAGSVLCQVRLGAGEIRSPLVPEGEADILLALDRLEALRHVHQLRSRGLAVVAGRTEPTPRMRMGLEPPPGDVLDRIRARVARALEVTDGSIPGEPGPWPCPGGLLLGVASPLLPLPASAWEEALKELESGVGMGMGAGVRATWSRALSRGREIARDLPEPVRRRLEPGPAAEEGEEP